MRGKRCQVCDGPIADGRCTLCGMPYRKDEVLYHLNENRSDHYRHATEQAKSNAGAAGAFGDRKSSGQKRASKMNTKTYQQQARRADTVTKKQKEKTSSKASRLGVIITVFTILFGVLPSVINNVRDEYQSKVSYSFSGISGPGITVWEDSDRPRYSLDEGYEAEVGFDLPPGTYELYVSEGSATIQVTGSYETSNYEIEDEDDFQFIYLEEGDMVSVREADSADGQVGFELLDEV